MLGYERYREQEERSSYGLVQDIVAAPAGALRPAGLAPGSLHPAVLRGDVGHRVAVALAPDPQQATDDAEGAVVLVLAGIRSLLDD